MNEIIDEKSEKTKKSTWYYENREKVLARYKNQEKAKCTICNKIMYKYRLPLHFASELHKKNLQKYNENNENNPE